MKRGRVQFYENGKIAPDPVAHLAAIRRRKIGFIYQSFNLLENLTALENVQVALLASRGWSRDLLSRAAPLLTEEALDLLDTALALWRGEPLDGLDLAFPPAAEIAALQDLHSSARETRLEAELAVGRQRDALPELESLLVADPLSERLHGLAALALYRSGRQAQALEVLMRLKRSLSAELGLSPGAAIEELEQSLKKPVVTSNMACAWAALRAAVAAMGTTLHEPFLQMAFLALPVIPHLKITDKGLVDVDKFELVG